MISVQWRFFDHYTVVFAIDAQCSVRQRCCCDQSASALLRDGRDRCLSREINSAILISSGRIHFHAIGIPSTEGPTGSCSTRALALCERPRALPISALVTQSIQAANDDAPGRRPWLPSCGANCRRVIYPASRAGSHASVDTRQAVRRPARRQCWKQSRSAQRDPQALELERLEAAQDRVRAR
jgi:hypothetical protein